MKAIFILITTIVCIASGAVYWNIGHRFEGKKLYLNSDARFYTLGSGWGPYWEIIHEETVDGIKFVRLENQGWTGYVLDLKGGCNGYEFNIWKKDGNIRDNQMFAFLDNSTVLSKCKGKNGQYKVVYYKAWRLMIAESTANIKREDRILTFTYYNY